MPTPDPNNVLFKIAHPDLYERNPFNVLNLPVDATAKDIRRRKEDIEAAFDAGTEASEFANILPGDEARKTPTRAEVDELFATLEDPEKRIAYALFWQWPERSNDESSDTTRKNPNHRFGNQTVLDGWEKIVARYDTSVEVRHNVAVLNHMMGLAYERSLLTDPGWQGTTPDDVSIHWQKAIRCWNAVTDDLDCWHFVSDLVSSLNDPRLDYRFARSLKEQFAFAFDQINVELAISFAKTGRESDAKRQVQYMRISQPESDDVEGTFDDAFSGLLRQTEAIVKTARDEAQKNPNDGLKKANEILSQTAEPLRVARIVFKKGAPIRDFFVTTIFAGVRSCLIAYGNKTEDWDNCIRLTQKMKALAETSEQIIQVEKDEQTITANKRQRQNVSSSTNDDVADCIRHPQHCVGCGKTLARNNDPYLQSLINDPQSWVRSDSVYSIRLFGNFKDVGDGKYHYQAASVSLPLCGFCSGSILGGFSNNSPSEEVRLLELALTGSFRDWHVQLQKEKTLASTKYVHSRTEVLHKIFTQSALAPYLNSRKWGIGEKPDDMNMEIFFGVISSREWDRMEASLHNAQRFLATLPPVPNETFERIKGVFWIIFFVVFLLAVLFATING